MCKAAELEEKELGFDPRLDQPEIPALKRKKHFYRASSYVMPETVRHGSVLPCLVKVILYFLGAQQIIKNNET